MIDARNITRPAPVLMTYYFIVALFTTVAFPIVILPLWFKYHTLRYRFDDEGVSMSWGILWKREILLTYRRIQDIHLSRGLIQRWLGLASISVQTASGSSTPEMTIEGVLEADELRDFLYQKMRGARGGAEGHGGTGGGHDAATGSPAHAAHAGATDSSARDALVLLREIRDEVRRLAESGGRGAGR